MTDMLKQIFIQQANLQRKIRTKLGQGEIFDQTTAERVEALKMNVFALTHELHELIDETSWKEWAKVEPFINRDLAVKEAIDALHFLINIFLHLDVSPAELVERYTAKNAVNHTRQDHDYDGVSTKCPSCRRALEDLVIHEVHDSRGVSLFQCECGEPLPRDLVKPFITD